MLFTMDTELRRIKVKRIYPKPHLRSFSEDSNIALSDTNLVTRRRRAIDTMFSVVQVKRDKNDAFEDGESLGRNKNGNATQRPTLSRYHTLDDTEENESQKESFLTRRITDGCIMRRARSGSGSMVFPSLKFIRQDSESRNARGYPINLSTKKYALETTQRRDQEEEIEQEPKRRSLRTVSFSNQSLLYSAISRDDVAELSGLIDSEDLDINLPNEVGITMLHRAAIDGSYRCLNFLLSKGAEIDVTDHEGWTPLHDAVFHGHIRCAVFLLTSGADVEAETKDFLKPIEMAEDEEMILVVGRAMALIKTGQNSNYDKETLV